MANAKPKAEQRQPWRDPEAKPYIEIQNVTKKFGEFTAVDDVSLNVYQGELFSLLGGSGCGKTTLLRMLAGFETPTSGRILIDGVDMARIPPYLRPTNMMFQSYALFPHMTVEQNVGFGLRQDGTRAGRSPSGSRTCSTWSSSTATASASPISSRAASASGSRSPAA